MSCGSGPGARKVCMPRKLSSARQRYQPAEVLTGPPHAADPKAPRLATGPPVRTYRAWYEARALMPVWVET
jgi:hypothetical protein